MRMGAFCCWVLLLLSAAAFAQGQVKIEKTTCLNLPNCYKLSNGTVEVVVTTDVGPRVIRYGFPGGDNVFAEYPELSVNTNLGVWKPYGGHRLWAAPEQMPRSYYPDNNPIQFKIEGNSIRLTAPVENTVGIQKEMLVTLDPGGSGVTVEHRITNRNIWGIDLAPWGLTIVHEGGIEVLPQEPFRSHDDYLLPARPLVLWYFTDMSDPRWNFGKKYIRLRTDMNLKDPQKVGLANKQGWSAYYRNRTLFVKRFRYQEGANYPDFGCNNETYTAAGFMEIESVGPMQRLEPGDSANHVERWNLFNNVDLGTTEQAIEGTLTPLISQTSLK